VSGFSESVDRMTSLISSASTTASANSDSDQPPERKERVYGKLASSPGYETSWQQASGLQARPVASSLVATGGLRLVLESLLVAALLLLLVAAV
jgi:hypothetical protein